MCFLHLPPLLSSPPFLSTPVVISTSSLLEHLELEPPPRAPQQGSKMSSSSLPWLAPESRPILSTEAPGRPCTDKLHLIIPAVWDQTMVAAPPLRTLVGGKRCLVMQLLPPGMPHRHNPHAGMASMQSCC